MFPGGEDCTARAWLLQKENTLGMLKYTPDNSTSTSQDPGLLRPGKVNSLDIYSPLSPTSVVVTVDEDGRVWGWNVSTRNFSTPLRWAHRVSQKRLLCVKIYAPLNSSEDIVVSDPVVTFGAESSKFPLCSPLAVCAGQDRVIYFVDVLTGTLYDRQLKGHVGAILCLAITHPSESPLMVSGSDEMEVIVWSLTSGARLFDLRGHLFEVNAVALYSPTSDVQDTIIISGSVDSTVRLWSYRKKTQIAALCDVCSPVNAAVVADFDSTGPVVIAGSSDASIKMWSLKGPAYELLVTLSDAEGHLDEITCLSVYRGEGCFDSLVSGSLDKCVIVWDLDNRKKVQKLEGHLSGVSSVGLFSTDHTDPSIVSSSTDVRIFFDFKSNSINQDYVDECFQFDSISLNAKLHNNDPWPRISALATKAGEKYFFNIYCFLFFKAVQISRSDFLSLFLPRSQGAVVKCVVQLEVLKLALAMGQRDAVHIIISNLVAVVDAGTCPDLRTTHTVIHTDDLLALAEFYPGEFERLLINLKLIRLSGDMEVGQDFLRKNKSSDGFDMGTITEMSSSTNDDRLCYAYLPIPIASHMELLQAMCDTCDSTNRTRIFSSQAGLMILGYSWAKYGRRTHTKLMVVIYAYILLATFNIYCFERVLLQWSHTGTRFFLILQMLFELSFAIPVVSGLYQDFFLYLSSIWNQLKVIIIVGGLVSNSMRLYLMIELRATRILLSVISIAMWFFSLYFLRAFEATGPLVKMVVKIANDSIPFLGILIVVNLGFSQAFWLVASENSSIVFSTWDGSLINAFSFMMGNFDPDAFDGLPHALSQYGLILTIIYMMVVVVLMLNLLIALMGDSFSQVADDGLAQWRLEQTKLIIANDYATPNQDQTFKLNKVVVFEYERGSSFQYLCSPDEMDDGGGEDAVITEALSMVVQQQKQLQVAIDSITSRLDKT